MGNKREAETFVQTVLDYFGNNNNKCTANLDLSTRSGSSEMMIRKLLVLVPLAASTVLPGSLAS